MRNAYIILVGNPEGKRPLGRLGPRWEGNERILEKQGEKMWTGCVWIRIGTSGGLL
jgi:hypothetical protein